MPFSNSFPLIILNHLTRLVNPSFVSFSFQHNIFLKLIPLLSTSPELLKTFITLYIDDTEISYYSSFEPQANYFTLSFNLDSTAALTGQLKVIFKLEDTVTYIPVCNIYNQTPVSTSTFTAEKLPTTSPYTPNQFSPGSSKSDHSFLSSSTNLQSITMNNTLDENRVIKQESQDHGHVLYNSVHSNQTPQQHHQQQQPQTYQQFTEYPAVTLGYTYSGTPLPLYSTDPYATYSSQPQIPFYYPQQRGPPQQQLPRQHHSHAHHQTLPNNSLVNSIPRFIRTSEVRQGTESLGYTGVTRMLLRTSKAELKVHGNLNTITTTPWTSQELSTSRRLVKFERRQKGSEIELKFEILSYQEYREQQANLNSSPSSRNNTNTATTAATETIPKTSYCIISCIQWRGNFYFTSVDCILLLEKLIGYKFGTDEKNRIRRNLEGYKPITISKSNIEFEGFFNLIKSYTDPKPINILKDVKVFGWYLLERALEKIISKYSACYDGRQQQQQPQTPQQISLQQHYQVCDTAGLGVSPAYPMINTPSSTSSASNYSGFTN